MDSVSPNIFVNDITKTIEFYKELGFSVVTTVPEQGELIFALMTCEKVTFMFQTFKSLGNELPEIKRQDGGSLLLYIKIKRIRLYKKFQNPIIYIKSYTSTIRQKYIYLFSMYL